MTKLEQVAEAIANFDLDGASGIYEQQLAKAARAAIETLREPTSEMARAGYEVAHGSYPDEGEIVWRAMIDAILNEKPDDQA